MFDRPKLSILSVALVLLVLGGVRSQTDQQKGNYNWAAALRGNLLLIDFDLSGKSDADKIAITNYRSSTAITTLTSSDSNIKLFLSARSISNERKKGRMSFTVVPLSNGGISSQGKTATLKISQPTRRLLEEDQSPSPHIFPTDVTPRQGTVFERRLLWAFTSSNTNSKDLDVYTTYASLTTEGALNLLMIYHLFTVIYWFVTIYLIFINPFFEYARKSVRIFWVGQYAFYFQFVSLFGSLSTWFYYEFDIWMNLLTYAHTRFFGLDYTWFSTDSERFNRYSAYIGKFSTPTGRPLQNGGGTSWNEDFYILAAQLPQVILYIIVVLLSLIPSKGIKEIFVSMRLGCTVSFGVHLSYISMQTIFQYFMGSTNDALDIASVIFAFMLILIPLIDVVLMKVQAMKLSDTSNFWTVPKAKGSFYFDIVGYTGHKKYRDYYPFAIGEAELILILAMLIPVTGTSSLTQAIIMLVGIVITFACVGLLPQFMKFKILNLVFYFLLLLFFIFVLVIELSPMVSVDTAKSLTIWMEILFMTILCWILMTLVIRIVDLMLDAPSTYGEKAKPIPPQKIKTKSEPPSKF